MYVSDRNIVQALLIKYRMYFESFAFDSKQPHSLYVEIRSADVAVKTLHRNFNAKYATAKIVLQQIKRPLCQD